MLRNTAQRYGLVSRLLHWLIGLLIIGLIGLGWYMVYLSYYDAWYHDSLTIHKALGMAVLVLALMKIIWICYSRLPDYPATLEPWERIGAKITHFILFAMMLAIPVTGYLISTSAGDPISIFGWFDIPALLPVNEELRDLAIEAHFYLAYGTAGLVLLHALAALKHQLIDKDGTLSRML